MAMEKLILFHINEQAYGINVEFVRAIESVTDIVRVPNAPSHIEGIINLRGEAIPVYSLHKKFNLPVRKGDAESQMIIAKSKDSVFAFVVDAVDEIHIVEEGTFLQPPNVIVSEGTSYMDGIVNVNDKLVLCVNVDQLMSEAERHRMQGFISQMA